MRFLVDESAGTAVVEYLRAVGHDVLAVAEQRPRADDVWIMAWATDEGRILITNDKDFGNLTFRHGQALAGILLLRLRDERPANRVAVVRTVVEHLAELLPGHFVVASESGVRVRGLDPPR
jgi:predicted nuclease of predicted toxin-antitoxin system